MILQRVNNAIRPLLWGLLLFISLTGVVQAKVLPGQGAVVSAHPLATEAGIKILKSGGNAFDAAVAVSAVLAVVEPYSSGMGGGGFWLLHRARDGQQVMIDGREKAPLAAHPDLYLDADGKVIQGASTFGPTAAGIPGQPAALVHISKYYGKLPLKETLAPAIRLAQRGFVVDDYYRKMASFRQKDLARSETGGSVFLLNNEIPPLGHAIPQPDLAKTLWAIAEQGHEGFYSGAVAEALVKGVRDAGGIWTMKDLATYQVVEREPIIGRYKNHKVISAALPSSGGVILVEMLNMLAGYQLETLSDTDMVHYLVEVMRRAYEDRAKYLGDADYVDVPVNKLINPEYALGRSSDIKLYSVSGNRPENQEVKEGTDTTHFSIVDREGNLVSATLSINYPFGACFIPPGTGILLNNEMDDFSSKPGEPNLYGLVGNQANAIEPGKRMLSSMTPTFVESKKGIAVLGTPGGSRIISMVLLAVLDVIEGKSPEDWVTRPRLHHQYLPDEIQFEPEALPGAVQDELVLKGHKLKPLENGYGNMQALYWNTKTGEVAVASDPRGRGKALLEEIAKEEKSTPAVKR